jgi:nucleoside-diphosphate-sugar epimerase
MNNNVLERDVLDFSEQFELWQYLRGKSFLITGATGLIGSIFIKCLLELNQQKDLGIKVVAVVRNIDKANLIFSGDSEKVDFRVLELVDISKEKINTHIDYVIHLASPTASKFFVEYPVETLRTAIEGTIKVLEYAKDIKVEGMIMASSLEVYGSNDNEELINEKFQGYVDPLEVRSSYNMGKRAAESLCHAYAKEYHVPVKIARLTQTTGAGISEDDNRVIVQFSRKISRGEDIVLHTTGESARPYCYTIDAISAMLFILFLGENGEAYNVANEDTYISAKDMAEYLKNNFNPSIDVRVELNDNMGYAPATKLRLDTTKLKKLGWNPRYSLYEIFTNLISYLC